MTHKKPHLPEKICPVCGRPFAWRKKWRNTWEQVVYCSKACAGRRRETPARSSDLQTRSAFSAKLASER